MMAGAGIMPPPFARADRSASTRCWPGWSAREERVGRGLRAAGDPAPAGRAGPARRQVRARASSPTRRPDAGWEDEPGQARDARRVRDRLARPPAGELDLARGRRGAGEAVGRGQRRRRRALVFASANPMLFCAGADIKAFTTMDAAGGGSCWTGCTACCGRSRPRGSPRSPRSTRSRSAAAASWRWLRRPDRRRLRQLRPAGDQPRDHSRLRWHPASAAADRRG